MKVFFLLGHTFFDQSMIMCREIEKLYPGSEFSAIVGARSDLMKDIRKLKNPKFKRYDWLSGLEKQWLETPLDKERLKKYEELLGTDVLRRIVIADRELGYGYLSTGIYERTKLIDLTLHNDDARWRYVTGLLDYLFDIFEKERPDIAFTYCVAGAVAFAIGEVARHFGVLFAQPVFTRIKHYNIICDNTTSVFTQVAQTFNEAKNSPGLLADFIPEAKEFLQNFKAKPSKPQDTLTWTNVILKNNSIKGIIKTMAVDIARWGATSLGLKGTKGVFRQRHGYNILCFNLKQAFALRKLAKQKHKYFSYDSPKGEYIYFPLHVDPEASTMVLSPFHTNQAAIIEAIAKNMPAGMHLIVKEHLPCSGRRPKGLYERISNIPGVTLVSPFLDNMALIKNASLIATITGTAGLEGIMLGKPVLVFGDVHYQIVGSGFVYHPEINTALDKAIKEAINLKPTPEEDIVTYLASIMRDGIELSPDDLWHEKLADISKREKAIKAMVDKIISLYNQKNSK